MLNAHVDISAFFYSFACNTLRYKLNAYILKASYVKLVQYKPQALSSLGSAINYTRVKVYNSDFKVSKFH